MYMNYNHLSDSKCFDARSLEQTSGGDIYHRTDENDFPPEEESSYKSTRHKGATQMESEKGKKTVSFGSEIWSDGTVKCRRELTAHAKGNHRSQKYSCQNVVNDESKAVPNSIVLEECACSMESRDADTPSRSSASATSCAENDNNISREASEPLSLKKAYPSHSTTIHGNTAKNNTSITPCEMGSESDQEVLREARELISGAKMALRRLEERQRDQVDDSVCKEYTMEERRQDEETSMEIDAGQVELSVQNEARDNATTATGEDNNSTISLNKLFTRIANVNEIVQGFVTLSTTTENENDVATEDECPSPPMIRRVHFDARLKLGCAEQTCSTFSTRTELPEDTRSIVGLSSASSEEKRERKTALITPTNQPFGSGLVTKSTLPRDTSTGSVSVSERVALWTRAHASEKLDDLVEKPKAFFWKSHPKR